MPGWCNIDSSGKQYGYSFFCSCLLDNGLKHHFVGVAMQQEEQNTRIQITLSPALRQYLEEQAELRGQPISSLVNHLIANDFHEKVERGLYPMHKEFKNGSQK